MKLAPSPGRIALWLAFANLGIVGVAIMIGGGIGMFAPMLFPWSAIWWGLAIFSTLFAIVALFEREMGRGILAMVLSVTALLPSVVLFGGCSLYGCF